MSLVRVALVLALAGVVAVLPVGCSDDSTAPGSHIGVGGNGGSGGVLTGPCEDGASRSCNIELNKHDNIVSCYVGVQQCVGGVWSTCGDGTTVTTSIPDGGPGSSAQALSSPVNCATNPCDPYCLNYNEDPDAGLDASNTPLYNWPGGSIGDLPGGLVNKGLKEPCVSGSDCQFNYYCDHPITTAGCFHSKCQAGAKMNWACDPCVNEICQNSPSCCTAYPDVAANGGTCSHSICDDTGQKKGLAADCDQGGLGCVATICATMPSCCTSGNNNWTTACKNLIPTLCAPLTCTGSAVTLPAGTWDAACVAKVSTVCGAKCGTGAPPPEDGTCTPWIPGQTDPSCPGIDLGAGIPCSANVPVCNHGQTAAPAGIRVIHFPANSNQYPKCDPDQTHPGETECFTTKPIPPGECITDMVSWNGSAWVAGCQGLGGNREIMINPQAPSGKPTPTIAGGAPVDYAGYVAECSCKDNWTLYSGGTCGPPTCGSSTQTASFKKPNFIIMMDRTQSMANSGMWTPAANGMKSFFQSAASAGLGIALEFFGLTSGGIYGDGCANGNCNVPPCANPMVPIGTLLAATGAGDPQETALVNAVNNADPNGPGGSGFGTRIEPALRGALSWAATKQAGDPTGRYDVIFLTDGDPSACEQNAANLAAIANAALTSVGTKTYVIALPGSTIAFLNTIAAGGGTTSAINTSAGNMAADLQNAFAAITGGGITCEYVLPAAGTYDPNDITVTYTPSSGTPVTTLPKRNDLAGCGGNPGWYYDNNVTPTKVLFCPSTCTNAVNDPGSNISVTVGCPKTGPQQVNLEYEGTCPVGAKPVWGFMSYNTSTPGSSDVTFRVRSAATQVQLSGAVWHPLAVASGSSPTGQVCPMAGPAPCPVDVFNALGNPDNILPWLELEVTLNPNGGTPVVNDWMITYSCPPSE